MTNQGLQIPDNHNSLKAGGRGPTLLEDFILREKITHFDHERIPERAVHARGSGAHGVFRPYKSMAPNEGVQLLATLGISAEKNPQLLTSPAAGVIVADARKLAEGEISQAFIAAMAQHRHWDRANVDAVLA